MLATDPIAPEPPRFSIRLPSPLWIAVATIVIVVAAAGMRIGVPIYRQQAAIREIERVDGKIERRPAGPEWLRRLVGDETTLIFDEPFVVHLGNSAVSDGDLVHLKSLSTLEWVDLSDANVTDAGLIQLLKLPRLDVVWLMNTRVGDAGLQNLTPILPRCTNIYLDDTAVGDAGLDVLRLRLKLEALSLINTRITDAGLVHISGLTSLKTLRITGTQVTDEGLENLTRLINLEYLYYDNRYITPAGIARLKAALPRLRE